MTNKAGKNPWIATSNMSLGAIVMFAALLLGWKKYVDRDPVIRYAG